MKSVLITGATKGLGRKLSENLINSGYEVFCVGRDKAALSELKNLGCMTLAVDFTEKESVWLPRLINICPEVDILVNSAGSFPIKNLANSNISDYDECFSVNVRAPFILMQEYVPKMADKGFGRVVNILSSSAYNGSKDTALYCASKHALLGLTRSAFLEYRDSGVKIHSISPGSMQTPMGQTDTRQDYNTFIKAEEVAEFIEYTFCLNSTMVIDEVRLNRSIIR